MATALEAKRLHMLCIVPHDEDTCTDYGSIILADVGIL